MSKRHRPRGKDYRKGGNNNVENYDESSNNREYTNPIDSEQDNEGSSTKPIREENPTKLYQEFTKQIKIDQKDTLNKVGRIEGKVGNIEGRLGKLDDKVEKIKSDWEQFRIGTQSKFNKIETIETNINNKIEISKNDIISKTNNNNNIQSLNNNLLSLKSAVQDENGQPIIRTVVKKLNRSYQEESKSMNERLDQLDTHIKNIKNNTEMMQSIPGKIDGLSKVLEDKNIRIKQELPAINHDEETLVELTKFGEEILQRLSVAARWYSRRLPELNAQDSKIAQLNEAHKRELEKAKEEGRREGRVAVIKDLLHCYGDLYKLMSGQSEGAVERLKILSNFLKNQGVEQIYDMSYEPMEITYDNIQNYENNIAHLQPGRIIITSPGYSFDTEIIEKASYKTYDDFMADKQIEEQNPYEEGNIDTGMINIEDNGSFICNSYDSNDVPVEIQNDQTQDSHDEAAQINTETVVENINEDQSNFQ